MGLNKEDSTSELCIPVLMVQMQNLTFNNATLYPPRPILSRERECRTNSGAELIRLPDLNNHKNRVFMNNINIHK